MISIRKATKSDIASLVELNDEVQRQHADAHPDDFNYPLDPVEMSEFFEKLLGRADHHLALGVIGSQAVAYLWYEAVPAWPGPVRRPKSRLFVHHIAVGAAYRRRGVAALLFEHLRGAAKSGGHSEISLDTWATNADGQAFFASQGFEVFRYSLRARVT